MKKSILDLAGAKVLTKTEQKNLVGGINVPPRPRCGYVCFPGCTGCPE